jgi:hypothetical protein
MMAKKAYRIEDARGKGPFLDSPIELLEPKYESDDYPTPDNDLNERDRRKFWASVKGHILNNGCTSLTQLRYWFNKNDCQLLAQWGFMLTEWEMTPQQKVYLVGAHQVVFAREEATCVQRKPVTALWAD